MGRVYSYVITNTLPAYYLQTEILDFTASKFDTGEYKPRMRKSGFSLSSGYVCKGPVDSGRLKIFGEALLEIESLLTGFPMIKPVGFIVL